MTLGQEKAGASKPVKRIDEDLPWVLDGERLENWTDQELYNLEVSFREWLFKAMKSSTWKVPPGRGKWNVGSRMTFDLIRQHFNIDARDGKGIARLTKLCKHYGKVRHTKNPIEVRGKKHSRTGYYLPRTPKQVTYPFCLRLRFELALEEGKDVTDIRTMNLPPSDKKTLAEMDATRRLQNAKRMEYHRRWKEKYGDWYGADKRISTDEDTDSGSGLDS